MHTSKSSKARVAGRGKPPTVAPQTTPPVAATSSPPSTIETAPEVATVRDPAVAHWRAMRAIGRRCGIPLFGESATAGASVGTLLAAALLGGESDAGPVGCSLRAIEHELDLVAEAVRAIDGVGHLGPVVRGLQRRIEVIAEVSDRIMLAAIAEAAEVRP